MTLREKLVQFQNQAEQNYVKKKSLKTILVYLVALIVFISSTLVASFSWPLRYALKKISPNKRQGIINISSNNINKIVSANDTLILNFTAHWCGPCLLMSDILENFALSKNRVVIGKINIDTNSGLTKKYNIRGVPQFLLIKNGIEIKRHVGPLTGIELEKFYEWKDTSPFPSIPLLRNFLKLIAHMVNRTFCTCFQPSKLGVKKNLDLSTCLFQYFKS